MRHRQSEARPGAEAQHSAPGRCCACPASPYSVSAADSEENQQAALRYLDEHLFNEEYVDRMLETGNIPPLQGLGEEIEQAESSEFLGYVYDSVRQAPSFQLSWDQAVDPSQEQALLENLDLEFQQEITPEQFAENMNATQPEA
ncbi:hypothetical protein [Nesterenkonia sp.]|uniref:hypothetical protein n=1 Tax=Nesterenkonia sp. TaxID=704201 RepID=UPI00260988DA|nr:hypothetical protein [Nesterenkonia sp.]